MSETATATTPPGSNPIAAGWGAAVAQDIATLAADKIAAHYLANPPANFATAPDELKTVDFCGLKFFTVGTFNGHTTTAEHLKQIVDAYKALKGKWKPFLKMRHADGKTFRDAPFACGWIENLRLEGKALVADFLRVPYKVAQLIKTGAFPRMSAEIWHDLTAQDGTVFPRVLKGIALLGAEHPALWETIDDVIDLYRSTTPVERVVAASMTAADREWFAQTFTLHYLAIPAMDYALTTKEVSSNAASAATNEENAMTPEQIEALKTEKAALETENASLKAAAAKPDPKVAEYQAAIQAAGYEVKEGKLEKVPATPADEALARATAAYQELTAKQAAQIHGQAVALFMQQQIEAGKIIPRNQALWAAALNMTADEKPVTYAAKEAGKPVDKSLPGLHSLLKELIQSSPKLVEYAEVAPNKDGSEGEAPDVAPLYENVSPESLELDKEIRSYQSKHQDMTYVQAYQAVSRAKRAKAQTRA